MYTFTSPLKLGWLPILPVLLFLAAELFTALQMSHSTPTVMNSPTVFATSFDSINSQVSSRDPFYISFAGLFWPSNVVTSTHSPIFPYKSLQENWIQSEGCWLKSNESGDSIITTGGHRAIYTDPLWKLSWIFVAPCYQESEYFGPFRFEAAL